MGSKNCSFRHVFRIAPGIIAIILLLQAAAGAQGNNVSSETGVTYTQDVPFSTESIAQVMANESKQSATEQGVIPFHMAPESKVLKQGMKQGTAPLKRMSAVKNELFQSLAPVLGSSFIGLTQTGSLIPPDTMGAAGPSHLMEILNDRVGFFNKSTGALISSQTLNDFWSSLGVSSFSFDPKVIYDQHSGRFIAVTLGGVSPPSSPNSWVMIAVSNTSDPTGTWSKWAIDADNDNGVHTFDNFADYPGIGVDANNVYLTANMFSNADVYQYSKVWVINKTRLLEGNASITVTEFRNPAGSGFVMQPAHVFGSSSTEYFVHENYSCPDPVLPCLALNNITFPGGTPTWNRMGDVVVNNYPSTMTQAPQQGGTIETNDIRLLNAVFRDGYLWTTHHVSNISKGNGQTEVAWYQINPANATLSLPFGTPAQQGRISDASLWYYFPSIAVNAVGDVGIGFSGSSSSEYAGAYYTARHASDAPGTMQSVGLLKAGLASYTGNRWGDFSATVIDPSDNTTFWTVQEYTATSTLWGTWWGKFVISFGVNLTVDTTTQPTAAGTNATYTIFLQNNGTAGDLYTLAVDNPDNATRANLSIASGVFVSPGETRNFTLNVTNSAAGNFSVNVTARSDNDTTKFMSINTTTTVIAVRGVNLTAASTAKTTSASVNATYTLTLQNTGTDPDSYYLTINNTDNASVFALNVSGNISLNASENRTLTLNVTNISSGVFRVNVTASSNNDSTRFAYINTTTTVPIVITIINPDNGSENNTGSVNVTVTLDANGTAKYLNWNGVNNTMTPNTSQPAGTVFSMNMTRLLSGNYSFKVYANDSNGVFNVSETRIITVNRTTVTNLSAYIDPQTGNLTQTVNLPAPSGNVTLTIFNGTNATKSGTPITNITIDSQAQVNSTYAVNLTTYRFAGENLTLGPEGANFTPDIQIRFNYTDAELAAAGIDEPTLIVQFYNTTSNSWQSLTPYFRDTTLNYTIVNVSHFSTFALVGTVTSGGGNNPSSSGGGGGGGGGGGPSGENYSNILVKENYDLYIAKDIVTSYAFTNKSNPVEFVNITGNTSAGIINVAVEALKNTSTLVKNPAPGIIYKNVNIWVGTTGFAVPKNIKEATIVFRVENSWLASNGLGGSDVRLEKWDGSQWRQLETSEITRDDLYTYFEGKTNSFSPFAITGSKGAGAQTATPAIKGTTAPAKSAVPAATRKAAGFEAIIVIAIFLAIYVRLRRRD
ncbi:MAG: PGF-pre-PGF domain-containing protein [Candidatus Methanoperedens sp.]|nr:PGF-pre-PGF domain-containing protein [Candidatus Methanoperedens sp.]MCZ7405037.1 PGF-pre-PGF domain-containing protein [Candidatus Methanoperedens sp.]